MKKWCMAVICLLMIGIFSGCTNAKSTESSVPAGAVSFQAVITEMQGEQMLVRPADGSAELKSSDSFSLSIKNRPELAELKAGDTVEIIYSGEIRETYPAQLAEIYSIKLIK